MENFPIPAPGFNGASRRTEVDNVFNWFRQGWAIFIVNPGAWIAMMVILIVIYLGLALVPWIGPLASHLLTPVLAAGMLLACERGRPARRSSPSPTFSPVSSTTPAAW
jgi:hypothetical protein